MEVIRVQLLTIILLILTLSICIINIIVLRQIIKDINNVDDRINLVKARIVDSFNDIKKDIHTESEVIQIKLDDYLSGDKYESYEPAEETKDD